MPAVITHHLFGEDALAKLPAGLVDGQEEKLAFLLANQGPDPFFMRFLAWPPAAGACHRLGLAMHEGRVVEALFAAREAVSHLPQDDMGIGRAFALGLVGHYLLDSRTHPFVYAQQNALIATDPSLAGAEREVHSIIECEIDSWMLRSLRGQTVLEAPPMANLAHTDRVVRVGGALFSQLAMQVFDIRIGIGDYEGSVDDYELTLALTCPPISTTTLGIAFAERLLRGKSYLRSLAHPVQEDDECPAANLACRPWLDATTGQESTLSFGDLYYLALDEWPTFAETYSRGDRGVFGRLTRGINYNGDLR